jgi:hypothetical protein
MGRKNRNIVKGKNSGKRFHNRDTYEPVDGAEVQFFINEDARMFGRRRVGA